MKTKKTFKEICEGAGVEMLAIPKHERESDIIKVIHKFKFEDRKYRITLMDGAFYFWATKRGARYFHACRRFETLEEAEHFLFTFECEDYLP